MTVADIIERLGGTSAAALKLGFGRTAIAQWKARGRVPPRHVPAVAKALDVPPETIWPDLAPARQQEAA